jgi:hypothetical protein
VEGDRGTWGPDHVFAVVYTTGDSLYERVVVLGSWRVYQRHATWDSPHPLIEPGPLDVPSPKLNESKPREAITCSVQTTNSRAQDKKIKKIEDLGSCQRVFIFNL